MATIEKEAKKTQKQALCSYEHIDNTICQRQALPGKEHCILHSPDDKKDEQLFKTTFDSELIRQNQLRRQNDHILNIEGFVFPINFVLESVRKRYDFSSINARKTVFLKMVNFHTAILRRDAMFVDATFHDLAFLIDVTFEGQAYFSDCTFLCPVDFSTSKFYEKAHFVDATFKQKASFEMVEFNKAANFSKTFFAKQAKFDNSTLENILFDRTTFGLGTSFSSTDLSKVEFRNTNVSHCEFTNSVGLEDCYLRHVSWENTEIIPSFKELFTKDYSYNFVKWISARRNKRWVLADEIKQQRPTKYNSFFDKPKKENGKTNEINALETAYRELKVNYEKHKNFPDAGQFHYGELEMRRLRKGWRRFISLAELYWLLSGYGERWRRSFVGLVVIVLICGIYYSKQGFLLPRETNKAAIIQNQAPTMKLQQDKPGKLVIIQAKTPLLKVPKPKPTHDFTEGLILSVKVALFRTDSFLQATSRTTRIIMALEMILAPIMLALLGLAISRQFKRS